MTRGFLIAWFLVAGFCVLDVLGDRVSVDQLAESGEDVVCSSYSHASHKEQCSNVVELIKLGKMADQNRCAIACKQYAVKESVNACCVFSQLRECVLYPRAGPVVDGSVRMQQPVPSYRGMATFCAPHLTPDASPLPVADRYSMFKKTSRDDLFRTIEPVDIKQGGLGDCWFMAAIASLARFPTAVRALFKQQFRSIDGVYSIRLYNVVKDSWFWVAIDDSFPADAPFYFFGQLKNAKLTNDKTNWVALLEKAMARMATELQLIENERGYDSLNGGYSELAIAVLTGGAKVDSYNTSSERFATVSWSRGVRKHGFWSSSWSRYIAGIGKESREDALWRVLVEGDRGNRLMAASISKKQASTSREVELANGLFSGHAYSVLRAQELLPDTEVEVCVEKIVVVYADKASWKQDALLMKQVPWDKTGPRRFVSASWETSRALKYGVSTGWTLMTPDGFSGKPPSSTAVRSLTFSGIVDDFVCTAPTTRNAAIQRIKIASLRTATRLVQVRNPWGSSEMFKGTWSDDDPEWAQHPDVANVLGFSPSKDGMWWMSYEDFLANFDRFCIGQVNMMQFAPPEPRSSI